MRVRTLRTPQELAAVAARWRQWQAHVNSDIDQFQLVCGSRPEIASPWVIVVEDEGAPIALIAARLEDACIAPSIGYLRPVRLRARVLSVIHQGVIGSLDREAARQVVADLRSTLAAGVADAVSFHHLPEGSPLLHALWGDGSGWLCDKTPRWSTHREMTLPEAGATDRLLAAKHRSAIRRRERELEKAHPGRIVWRFIDRIDDIGALCARLEEPAARSYQRGLGTGFYDNEEFRRRLELFASRDMLRVQTLEIDGRVRAFWFGIVYSGVFHSSETAYDPDLREHEVGTLMFLRLIGALAAEGVGRLDFGLGDAHYKRRFGDRSWRETSTWMYAPRPKGIAMMLAIRLAAALDGCARRLVERAGLEDRLRTAWRRLKTRRATSRGPMPRPARSVQ